MKETETRTAVISFDRDRILRVVLKDGANVTLEDSKSNHEATLALVGEQSILVHIDSRPAKSISRDARVFLSDKETRRNTIAQTIIVDSGISRVMGNFFIGLNKPPFPVKLFVSCEEAEIWLRGHIK